MKNIFRLFLAITIVISFVSCGHASTNHSSYGVFLSVEDNLNQLSDYETVVIDAQAFSKRDITEFKAQGHKVLTYINIGSLEEWRDYYSDYSCFALGEYEHWEDEVWIDVSDPSWQEFVIGELIPELVDKGVDGFFVDNCDVYYHYPTTEIMNDLTNIMTAMVDTGLDVLINGGDCYLDAYCDAGGSWNDVITGINQETVFSAILWSVDESGEDEFGVAEEDNHEYFMDYVERYAEQGADIYLLEYTRDEDLIREIDEYCEEHGFDYYVSSSVELVNDV